ncbi:NAD(P)-dependent oxidoreductase [Vibrio sp. F74]|uniref:NAD(P)-dependent oxidoreductase n=1 Tax=Vibrio sp. F74 TaxID=700020 RepID=UPI0035F53AC7
MKTVLVLGASGATGQLVVQQCLEKGINVTAIVRAESALPESFNEQSSLQLHSQALLQVIKADISMLPTDELAVHLESCNAVISCLGHNLTAKGMFGQPRKLVTDAVTKVANTLETMTLEHEVKFILMNTTGNSNDDIPEKPPVSQRMVISALRWVLPPHLDNEKAADFLRLQIGQQHKHFEWVVVRPDSLTDEPFVSRYELHNSPLRNVIFDAGKTSRINVANFMFNLISDEVLWDQWKGKMPVIYNRV